MRNVTKKRNKKIILSFKTKNLKEPKTEDLQNELDVVVKCRKSLIIWKMRIFVNKRTGIEKASLE